MRRRLLAPLLLTVLTACAGAPAPSAGPATATATAPAPAASAPTVAPAPARAAAAPAAAAASAPVGTERRTLQVGDRRRAFLLVRPRPGATVQGAVLVLHAQNQTMGQAHEAYGLGHLPGRGQLVAYLGGHGGSWNTGSCCGRARADGVDDLGFLRAVIADLRDSGALPPARPVSLLGYSSGAMLAWSAVCHADLGLRLVVSVAGTRGASCTSARLPHRFVELHGALDTTIALDPPARYSRALGTTPVATRPATRTLARAAGCTRTVDGGRTRTDHGGCRGGGVVRLLVQPRAGHQYRDLAAPVVLTRALEEVGQIRP